MRLETSLHEHGVIKLAGETGCYGGMQQLPSLEISKGKPGMNLSGMS